MREYKYYCVVIFALLISLAFFYQRDYFDVKIHSEQFVLINATISKVENALFYKKTYVEYYINEEVHYNEISYSNTDKVGENIMIYYDAEGEISRRVGYVHSWDLYSVMMIVLVVCIIGLLLYAKLSYFGHYKNEIYKLVYGFSPNLWIATYFAAMQNKAWKLWVMILIWGIAMLMISVVAKRSEIEKRNQKYLEQYSKNQDDIY